MKIAYISTILLIYIAFILINKSEKKQNLIKWFCIASVLILCYNILICLILTFIGVQCSLQNLLICNCVVIGALVLVILKTKKIQKYYIKVLDIVSSIIILAIVILVGHKIYGFPFNLNYRTVDGSTHYFFAQQFYENSTLLFNEITDDALNLYNPSFRLPGAYINEGILFKVFDTVALKTDLYILFDLFVLYLSGLIFYFLLKTYARENKKLNILAIIFSVMYMLGYPLNSMLYGFVYLSLALDIIITFLLLVSNYQQDEIQIKIILPILSLLSFGIFFSYAYFIPLIYIAIVVYIIINSIKKKEKILSSKNLLKIIYLNLIPSILGISYFMIFPIINGMKTEISTINMAGDIYENYITNYVIFISIYIIYAILKVKHRKEKSQNHFETVLFVLSILFAIILFIGYKFGIVSRYYFFKSYYIVWPLSICSCYIAISYILANKNKIINTIIYLYVIIYVATIAVSTVILQKNIIINDIWSENLQYIKDSTYILNNEQLQLLNKLESKLLYDNTYVLAPKTVGRVRWISVLLHNQYIYIDGMYYYICSINEWLDARKEEYYFAYYEDYEQITEDKIKLDENSNKYEIIYNDEYAFFLKRK